ncbi:MAG: VOC family protein [Lachnospiraceae bacterium]|nr:VOC family protein [Lachnospiraceae bacterium]
MTENYSTGVQHIGIPTKCFNDTIDFYKKLGFGPVYETVNDGARVSFMKLGNLVFEIYEDKNPSGVAGGIDHVALNVQDIDQTYKDVCALGLNTQNDEIHFLPYWDNGVRFFTIMGPNMEKIEFSQFL